MADAPSMFDKLAQGRQKSKTAPTIVSSAVPTPPLPEPLPDEPPKRRQRKATGKRSDPSYIQVGAYIPIELNKSVKRLLVDSDHDFSELVTDLLTAWVRQNDT